MRLPQHRCACCRDVWQRLGLFGLRVSSVCRFLCGLMQSVASVAGARPSFSR